MGNDKGGASNGDLATEFAEEVSKCTQKVSVVKDQVRIASAVECCVAVCVSVVGYSEQFAGCQRHSGLLCADRSCDWVYQ
jgi:hypothetical protein